MNVGYVCTCSGKGNVFMNIGNLLGKVNQRKVKDCSSKESFSLLLYYEKKSFRPRESLRKLSVSSPLFYLYI
jgi:hypothetical protein